MNLAIITGALSAVSFLLAEFYKWSYRRGWRDGIAAYQRDLPREDTANAYLRGRNDADNWWLGIEREADQPRREMLD